MSSACRECGGALERQPGKPRVCEACLPAFKARLLREGTPSVRYAWPEEVLGVPSHEPALKRLRATARRAAAASRIVNDRALAELRRRGESWRKAGLGSFATLEAVREAGVEA